MFYFVSQNKSVLLNGRQRLSFKLINIKQTCFHDHTPLWWSKKKKKVYVNGVLCQTYPKPARRTRSRSFSRHRWPPRRLAGFADGEDPHGENAGTQRCPPPESCGSPQPGRCPQRRWLPGGPATAAVTEWWRGCRDSTAWPLTRSAPAPHAEGSAPGLETNREKLKNPGLSGKPLQKRQPKPPCPYPNVQDTVRWAGWWSPRWASGCGGAPKSPGFFLSAGCSYSNWPAGGSLLCRQHFHRNKVKCHDLKRKDLTVKDVAKTHKMLTLASRMLKRNIFIIVNTQMLVC